MEHAKSVLKFINFFIFNIFLIAMMVPFLGYMLEVLINQWSILKSPYDCNLHL